MKKAYIVGPGNLNSDLIAYALRTENGIHCESIENIKDLPMEVEENQDVKKLLLIDFSGNHYERVLADIENNLVVSDLRYLIALFNLEQGLEIEHDALRRGIQGFFYKQDSLELFLKGVETLFTGEIWLSRNILVNLVLNSTIVNVPAGQEKASLTNRETEILALASTGARNDEIAEKLFVSPHTVKTHLYNVFKKINVHNRFQAALWAAKNL